MALEVQAERLARVTCAECGREWRAGELWRLLWADLREVAVFCPCCAEREFPAAVSDSDT
ncbi:MAG TPA: hypothetical protein VK488_05430 [Gaiellaceae bacterium]|nr:hypothetical protein [Gaiellaceae bacterium]